MKYFGYEIFFAFELKKIIVVYILTMTLLIFVVIFKSFVLILIFGVI